MFDIVLDYTVVHTSDHDFLLVFVNDSALHFSHIVLPLQVLMTSVVTDKIPILRYLSAFFPLFNVSQGFLWSPLGISSSREMLYLSWGFC